MIADGFQQIHISVDRQIPVQAVFGGESLIERLQDDFPFGQRFDAGASIEGDRRVQDGSAVNIRIGTDIRSSAGEADS